jgi:hypothetical protein
VVKSWATFYPHQPRPSEYSATILRITLATQCFLIVPASSAATASLDELPSFVVPVTISPTKAGTASGACFRKVVKSTVV